MTEDTLKLLPTEGQGRQILATTIQQFPLERIPRYVAEILTEKPSEVGQLLRVGVDAYVKKSVPPWMTPPEEQIENLLKWKKLHEKWDYPDKGEFPEFDKKELLKNTPPMPTGNKPVVTLVPYLSTPIETLAFIVDVVWPHVYAQHDWSVWVWNKLRPFDEKIRPIGAVEDWRPGVRWVTLDLERYPEKDGNSAQSIREKGELLSVEPLVHFAHASHDLITLNGKSGRRYITITGFTDDESQALFVNRDLDGRSIDLSAYGAGDCYGPYAVAAPPGA